MRKEKLVLESGVGVRRGADTIQWAPVKQQFAWLVGVGGGLCERVCGSSSQTVATPEELDLGLKQHSTFILDCSAVLANKKAFCLAV